MPQPSSSGPGETPKPATPRRAPARKPAAKPAAKAAPARASASPRARVTGSAKAPAAASKARTTAAKPRAAAAKPAAAKPAAAKPAAAKPKSAPVKAAPTKSNDPLEKLKALEWPEFDALVAKIKELSESGEIDKAIKVAKKQAKEIGKLAEAFLKAARQPKKKK